MTNSELEKHLENCILTYVHDGKVFHKWFFENGKGYYFLFKKNLKVTNLQFAELASLIRLNAQRGGENVGEQLLFLSVKEFNTSFSEILSCFTSDKKTFEDIKGNSSQLERFASELSKQFTGLLKNVVVLDAFYGSCAVYVPPGIEIFIDRICSYSGYIHSCGKNIFTRNVSKANKNDFLESIKNYINSNDWAEKQIFFAVYAHEDFSKNDRHIEEQLKHGLDDVKIYVEKYFMGKDSLVDILKELKVNHSDRLIIPDAGDYRKKHKEARKNQNVHKNSSIWLLIDNSISPNNIQQQGNDRYYICYEQLYMNENQFQLFDENKPAWKSSTTIPHTMIAAMINLTLPYCKDPKEIHLYDPFVGTGTTFLESIKYPNIKLHFSDLDHFAKVLVKDNLSFFCSNIKELNATKQYLKAIGNTSDSFDDIFNKLLNTLNFNRTGEFDFLVKEVEIIKNLDYKTRLILYILLRVKINARAALDRGSEDFKTSFNKEVTKLYLQIDRFIKLKKKSIENIEAQDNISFFQGSYSKSSMINTHALHYMNSAYSIENIIDTIDVRFLENKKEDQKYDVIITDPPYGFNTTEDVMDLAKLYSAMIKNLIKSLKNDGQIVMALPDRSHSGKISPFFTHKEIVIQQFLMIAQDPEINMEVISNVTSLPFPSIFKPPFYWESERALKRSILYFRLRKKRSNDTPF